MAIYVWFEEIASTVWFYGVISLPSLIPTAAFTLNIATFSVL
jgi:hypothetical protein